MHACETHDREVLIASLSKTGKPLVLSSHCKLQVVCSKQPPNQANLKALMPQTKYKLVTAERVVLAVSGLFVAWTFCPLCTQQCQTKHVLQGALVVLLHRPILLFHFITTTVRAKAAASQPGRCRQATNNPQDIAERKASDKKTDQLSQPTSIVLWGWLPRRCCRTATTCGCMKPNPITHLSES